MRRCRASVSVRWILEIPSSRLRKAPGICAESPCGGTSGFRNLGDGCARSLALSTAPNMERQINLCFNVLTGDNNDTSLRAMPLKATEAISQVACHFAEAARQRFAAEPPHKLSQQFDHRPAFCCPTRILTCNAASGANSSAFLNCAAAFAS